MKVIDLLRKLNYLVNYENVDPESEIVIGHYNKDGLVNDLDLREVDWLFESVDDDSLPNFQRKKVIELQAYEMEKLEHLEPDQTCKYYD